MLASTSGVADLYRSLSTAGCQIDRDYVWCWDHEIGCMAVRFRDTRQELMVVLHLPDLIYKEN